MKVLVTGANEYIGMRFLMALGSGAHEVVAAVRNAARIPADIRELFGARLSVLEVDFLEEMSAQAACPEDVEAAYYLIHSMGGEAFSTVAVQTGLRYHLSVAMAKGAVEGLVRSLAAEFAPKIRVNGLALSLTDTALAEKLVDSDKRRKSSEERHPLKAIGDPKDVASLAACLLSDEAKFMTGQIIGLDGGMGGVRGL